MRICWYVCSSEGCVSCQAAVPSLTQQCCNAAKPHAAKFRGTVRVCRQRAMSVQGLVERFIQGAPRHRGRGFVSIMNGFVCKVCAEDVLVNAAVVGACLEEFPDRTPGAKLLGKAIREFYTACGLLAEAALVPGGGCHGLSPLDCCASWLGTAWLCSDGSIGLRLLCVCVQLSVSNHTGPTS